MTINEGKRATKGNTIVFHYTAKLDNGKIIRSSKKDKPIKCKLGKKQIRSELEEKFLGMKEGDTQVVTVHAKNAFGHYRKDLVFTVDKAKLSEKGEPKIGAKYRIKEKNNGKSYIGRITKIDGNKVTLDANHILAGKDINYKIELIKIIE
ncbi:MAG: FKBP-type peptidyl-prolyl cis-trans isomerase [bacterium]|nr:MAG: FKBP-type peptidyl-prolyl cis-trans isomerase [bacterium]